MHTGSSTGIQSPFIHNSPLKMLNLDLSNPYSMKKRIAKFCMLLLFVAAMPTRADAMVLLRAGATSP
jgi:hypothetical protein